MAEVRGEGIHKANHANQDKKKLCVIELSTGRAKLTSFNVVGVFYGHRHLEAM
jgi:hypothetical protein